MKSKEKILITGSSGLLGLTLLKILKKTGYEVTSFSGDITKNEDIKNYAAKNSNYAWIIHTAAITNIEECEKNKKHCHRVNVFGTQNILNLAKQVKAKFLYISTVSVFSCETGDYKEKDQPEPINYYSETKYLGEKIALTYPLSLILRINLIGIHPKGSRGLNFFEWLYDSFSTSQDIQLYKDILVNPLSNWTLAEFILRLLKQNIEDKILHLTSKDVLSKAAIGQLALKFFPHYQGKIELVKINQANNSRGSSLKNMWLNADLIQKKYGFKLPSLQEEVSKIFSHLT